MKASLFLSRPNHRQKKLQTQKLLQRATTEAPDELQRIKRQPTRLKHRATPKLKLPTGETITEHQKSRRVHHAGFPPITQALPKDIQQEDIIKHWPNHLWGPFLLRIAALWTPKEISKMTPFKFGPNSVVKRVKAARIQEGQDSLRAKKRKRQPASKDAESSDELQRLLQSEPESEASRAFRISQGDSVRESDPEYDLHQMGLLRRQPRLDRELISRASKEREKGKE